MAISANGWDAVEEWVYFLSSIFGQCETRTHGAGEDLRKRVLKRLDDVT